MWWKDMGFNVDEFIRLSGVDLERWSMSPPDNAVFELEDFVGSGKSEMLDWHHQQVVIYLVRKTRRDDVRSEVYRLINSPHFAVSSMALDVVRMWEAD